MKNILLYFFVTIHLSLLVHGGYSQDQNNSRVGQPSCICLKPCIISQPVSPSPVCVNNGSATFSVTVTGSGPFQYQWRENTSNISDNNIYSGTNSPTLTITNPPYALNGKTYRCIITNCSGIQVITNNQAMLTVSSLPSDINKDGVTEAVDFNLLNIQYSNTCLGCAEDITADGIVNNDDFLILLGEYGQSCQ